MGANRLAIPAWAASEYLCRVTSKGLGEFTPKSKEPSQILKALDAMHETASLFVDESLLRRIGIMGDRAAYLNEFRGAIDALSKCTRAFSEQFDPGIIHEEIVHHLSSAILDSDLTELSKRASQDGYARYEHRLPPGFLDGDKEKNRFGDLIIWYEILDKSAISAVDYPNVMFITNDEKKDWVYAPKFRVQIVGGVRKPVGNTQPEIKIADPRLISEFHRRTAHPNLSICSLATLIEGLSKVSAAQFVQLAAAIQIDTENVELTDSVTVESDASESGDVPNVVVNEVAEAVIEMAPDEGPLVDFPPVIPTVPPDPPAQPRLVYDLEALQDGQYQSDAPEQINEIIRDLKSHNWYTQNPAITKIRTIRDDLSSPSSWFVLGRNIYQAACGNSQKAMEFMAGLEAQLAQFPEDTAQHLLSGMLFEVYFDASGRFRDTPKFAYADKLLTLVTKPRYDAVLEFITFQLQDNRQRLRFLPGEVEKRVVRIVSEPLEAQNESPSTGAIYKLGSVMLELVDLMYIPPNDGSDLWGQLTPGSLLNQQNLRDKISEDLAIPKWAISLQFEPAVPGDARFVIPEGRVLNPKRVLELA